MCLSDISLCVLTNVTNRASVHILPEQKSCVNVLVMHVCTYIHVFTLSVELYVRTLCMYVRTYVCMYVFRWPTKSIQWNNVITNPKKLEILHYVRYSLHTYT